MVIFLRAWNKIDKENRVTLLSDSLIIHFVLLIHAFYKLSAYFILFYFLLYFFFLLIILRKSEKHTTLIRVNNIKYFFFP